MKKKNGIFSFPKNYWTVIFMEFFERGSYYGIMSVLSVYLVATVTDGGLGFSKEGVGVILSIITFLIYFLPILSGAIAERFGYRKVLMGSFIVMSLGYFFTGISDSYFAVFTSLMLVALGAGFFKPIISGTIARSTNEDNSALGFGIFYWAINLGAFLVPLILIPILKGISYSYIFYMAAIATGSLFFLNLFVYKEPKREQSTKSILTVFKEALMVVQDVRFVALIGIYSCFWILYFQMYGSVLWYVRDYVDASSLNEAINKFLSLFVDNPNWKFDVEHVTVINAGTIICLQLVVSAVVKKWKPLPTMITGISIATLGMIIFAISTNIWVFLIGTTIFSLGEMTAHPKFLSYVGLIAPEDKKALYLGYSFLYGAVGSIGGFLGAKMYTYFVDKLHNPSALWAIFSGVGVMTIVGLVLFNKFVSAKKIEG